MLGLAAVFYGITWLTGGDFIAFVVYEAAALLFSLVVYLRLARGERRPARRPWPPRWPWSCRRRSPGGRYRVHPPALGVRPQRALPPRPARRPGPPGRRTPPPALLRHRGSMTPATLAADVAAAIDRELRTLRREIEAYPDERQIWEQVPGSEQRRHARAPPSGQPAALHRRALGGHGVRARPRRGVRPPRGVQVGDHRGDRAAARGGGRGTGPRG